MTPRTLDAAWEALEIELDDDHRVMSVIARHRPLIEAALTQPPVLLSLSINEQTVTHPAEPTLRDAARALRERLTIDPGNVVSWGEWDTLDEALAAIEGSKL